MIKEIKDFKRIKLFKHYHSFNNPFIITTIKIDVTNIVNYCKINKNFYATLGFLVTKTANQVDAFKYRYKDNKFYYCDEVTSNYTQMYNDGTIGYFSIPNIKNYNEYIKEFLKTQNKFIEENEYLPKNDLNEIWLSCTPWFSFTSLVTPFNKEILIPQFIWDKYENIDGKYYLNLMIMIHHGFADGYHVGEFIKLLQENINLFN